MTSKPRLLVHRTPGETRAAAFDRHGKPFRLFLQRWGGEGGPLRCGARVEARLRANVPDQGGSFFRAASGEEIFVRTKDAGKLTQGAAATIEIQSEARSGKLARGKLTSEADTSGIAPLEGWASALGASLEDAANVEQFDRIDSAFDEALSPWCPLPGGGNIGIERTRALTAIDIDTAGRAGKGSAGARAFAVNREAASEAARQLSLRNLGGLVVLDCVGPVTPSSAEKLKGALVQAFGDYSNRRIDALKPSAFGLLEAQLSWAEAPIADRLVGEDGLPTAETELLALFRAAARETAANRSGFYRLTLSGRALPAYIARRKQCDQLLKEAFSGRVSIASGKGEKSVVRKE